MNSKDKDPFEDLWMVDEEFWMADEEDYRQDNDYEDFTNRCSP